METITEQVKSEGGEVVLRDLYAMNFDPVLSETDLDLVAEGKYAADVIEEQNHIKWCNIMVFICTVWWGAMPAIAKGYMDRVFAPGFAYECVDGKIRGLLEDKQVAVIQAQGQPREPSETEIWPHIRILTTDNIFHPCGMKSLGHLFFPEVTKCGQEVRVQYLNEITEFIKQIK